MSTLGEDSDLPTPDSMVGERERVAAALFGRAPSPTKIGRYTVEAVLDRGAMGVVYVAWDEDLRRTVAVKLISRNVDMGSAEHRFQREALALAKLSHPNVVTIHEVGRHDARLFIAMELVRGETLEAWMRAKPRAWKEVVEVFTQAGRGLDAAHAAGLIHRDFKPANCIVGDAGRVRVLDFGLARAMDLLDEDTAAMGSVLSRLDVSVTRTGATVGTPAYMAPEQLRGEEASAASDQFSLCVALYEAVEGVRPFGGRSVLEIHRNIEAGVLQRGAAKGQGALLDVVKRGLAVTPAERWPSVGALVDALEEIPRQRARRRRVWGMSSFGLAAATVAGAAWFPDAPCEDVPATNVWNERRRATLQEAIGDGGSWETLDRAASRWVRMWGEAQERSCRAARVERSTSELTLARQRACLQRWDSTGTALLSALETSSNPSLDVPKVVRSLPSFEGCLDVEAVLQSPPEAVAADVADVRQVVDASLVASVTGDPVKAAALAREALEAASRTDFGPLRAEAGLQLARVQLQSPENSVKTFEAAYLDAEASGADALAAEVAIGLVLANASLEQPALAERWERIAEAKLRRSGPRPKLLSQLAFAQLERRLLGPDIDDLDEAVQRALQHTLDAHGPDSLELAEVRQSAARSLERMRGSSESLEAHDKAVAELDARLGPQHPRVAVARVQRGLARLDAGEPQTALADFEHGLLHLEGRDLERQYLGAAQGFALARLAGEGDRDEAFATLEDAAQRLPVGDPDRLDAEQLVAALLLRSGKAKEALRTYEALALARRSLPEPDPIMIALELSNAGECLLALERWEDARARFAQSLRELQLLVPNADPRLAYPLSGLGWALLKLGSRGEALASLERAYALIENDERDPQLQARTSWALSHSLRPGPRQRALFEASKSRFSDIGEPLPDVFNKEQLH